LLHTLSEALVRSARRVFLLAVLDSSGVPMPAAMDILVMFLAYKSPIALFHCRHGRAGFAGGNLMLFLLSRHGVRRSSSRHAGQAGPVPRVVRSLRLVTVSSRRCCGSSASAEGVCHSRACCARGWRSRSGDSGGAGGPLFRRSVPGDPLGLGAQDYVKHNAWTLTGVQWAGARHGSVARMAERRRAAARATLQ